MGIEDRDWFREKKLNYDYGGPYEPNRFGGEKRKPPRSPNRCLFAWAFIIFLSLGLRVYLHFLPAPRRVVIQQRYAAQTSPLPPVVVSTPPPQPFLPPPAPPAVTEPAQPESTVISSSAESQTLHYYKKNYSGMKYLTVEINNVPFEVTLDTGASNVVLTTATIQRLGISRFMRKARSFTAAGPVDGYLFQCASIKLGTMTVNNATCEYQPTLSGNLLGNSFLSNFKYTINDEEETVTLVPKYGANISNTESADDRGAGWAEVDGKKYRYEEGRMKEMGEK
jgi:clan AA aspartic protease (TIGR02281 family)